MAVTETLFNEVAPAIRAAHRLIDRQVNAPQLDDVLVPALGSWTRL
jgi:hypothetical protein